MPIVLRAGTGRGHAPGPRGESRVAGRADSRRGMAASGLSAGALRARLLPDTGAEEPDSCDLSSRDSPGSSLSAGAALGAAGGLAELRDARKEAERGHSGVQLDAISGDRDTAPEAAQAHGGEGVPVADADALPGAKP